MQINKPPQPTKKEMNYQQLVGGDIFEYEGSYYIKEYQECYGGSIVNFRSLNLKNGTILTLAENSKVNYLPKAFLDLSL